MPASCESQRHGLSIDLYDRLFTRYRTLWLLCPHAQSCGSHPLHRLCSGYRVIAITQQCPSVVGNPVVMSRQRSTLALLLAAALSLSACTININAPARDGHPMDERSMISGEHNVEMFAFMMIPHHQQAIDMSTLALERSTNSDIHNLASRIIAGQTPEITLMKTWISGDDGMSGMMSGASMPGMGGMASDEEMDNLTTLDSPDFDREFLSLMIEHHEGALDMVQMIEDSTDPDVAGLARDIVRVQTEEIAEMTALRDAL